MAKYIERHEDGSTVEVTKGKGRTRLGWNKSADGNFYKDPTFSMAAHKKDMAKPRQQHFYITLDAQGNEISRDLVGRGRPKKEFKAAEDGNFYRTMGDNSVVAPPTEVGSSEVSETMPDGTEVVSSGTEVVSEATA